MQWDQFKDTAPRKAAAGIIINPQGEILLGRRNQSLMFMGGHHVFPGGALDDEDSAGHVAGVADSEEALAIFGTAREIFEETGLLCVDEAHALDRERLRAHRRALHAGELNFAAVLDALGVRIRGDRFTAAGIWITPPFSPIRFHTRYYLHQYEGPRIEEVESADGEIVGLDWLHPAEARRRWQMGQLRLSTPVAYVLLHLAARPLPDVLPLLQNTPHLNPDEPSRFEMRRGIHIIPVRSPTLPPATHTNCVTIGEHEILVVDPGAGSAEDAADLVSQIEHLRALGDRITAILLTHSHPDHSCAAEALREHFGVPVWAHAETAKQLEITVDRHLADGDQIDLPGDPGWRIRCIHTPGHDPGHLCFHEESTSTLIAGDMIANPGTILIAPSYRGNMSDYLASLERLLEEEFSFLVPAHGIPFWGRECKPAIEQLIKHRLDREAKIQAALDAGLRTPGEIVAHAYADTPKEAWPLAEHQLEAHLERLGVTL